MTPDRRLRSLPALLAILVVAGTGVGAVVATSLGLMPLVGQPVPSLQGWSDAAPDLLLAVRESLVIAVGSTVLAALAGLLLASVMLGQGRGSGLVRVVAAGVLALPHLVGAASVGLLLSDGGMAARVTGVGGWPQLVAGPWPVATVLELAWKESAFVALVVVAALGPQHRRRVEAATVLGARPFQRWSRVLVPASLPAVGAASLIVFVYTVGSYEVAWLLGRAYPEPLPVLAYRLFSSIDLASRPAAAAAATTGALLALGVALAVLAATPRLRTSLAPVAPTSPRPGDRGRGRR